MQKQIKINANAIQNHCKVNEEINSKSIKKH